MNIKEETYHKLILTGEELELLKKVFRVVMEASFSTVFDCDEDDLLDSMSETLNNYKG